MQCNAAGAAYLYLPWQMHWPRHAAAPADRRLGSGGEDDLSSARWRARAASLRAIEPFAALGAVLRATTRAARRLLFFVVEDALSLCAVLGLCRTGRLEK